MSLPNPNKPVTEERLQEFYNMIKPYLGLREMPSGDMDEIVSPLPSVSHGNANPTGTIISFMGNYAPDGYLACDGSTKNIADYPRLANFFQVQFGSINKFGGDGTTTFAVPNLQGEFLRGTGTNGHSEQGSGSAVGTHQNATKQTNVTVYNNELYFIPDVVQQLSAPDFTTKGTKYQYLTNDTKKGDGAYDAVFSSRPTNTSILYCIKD